jgi:hypothetical protein
MIRGGEIKGGRSWTRGGNKLMYNGGEELHAINVSLKIVLSVFDEDEDLDLPTIDGKTARGASSPAKPALHMPEPLSTTRAWSSSPSDMMNSNDNTSQTRGLLKGAKEHK